MSVVATPSVAGAKPEVDKIDRENPEALCNWVQRKRAVDGRRKKIIYVNKVTGHARPHKPNVFTHGRAITFPERSMGFFHLDNPARTFLIWLITSKSFDNFILFTIILNSIFLAIPDFEVQYGVDLEYDLSFKTEDSYNSWWRDAYKITASGELEMEADPEKSDWTNLTVQSEIFFTVIFTLECVLKIAGMGFVMGNGAYLKDGWNVLDFIVVVSGFVSQLPGFPRISALRTIRVMRPLRSLSVLPGMRNLINTLLNSIPALMTVVTLLAFVFVIFGILAIQLWGGIQHYRCRITSKPLANPEIPLVYDCSGQGMILKKLCTANEGDFEDAYECENDSRCFLEEHRRLMGIYFGGEEEYDIVTKYAAAMVTRVFEHNGEKTELHYCGHDHVDNEIGFPSYLEGRFPDRVGFVKAGETHEDIPLLSSLSTDDAVNGLNCFWPVYEDGRVCSKEGVGLGGGLNVCGNMEMAFPATEDWLPADSKLTRAVWSKSAEADSNVKADGKDIQEKVDPCEKISTGDVLKSYFDQQMEEGVGQCFDIESYHADRRADSQMFVKTTCGSNFDYWGNERWSDEVIQEAGHYQEGLAFGYIRFNWIMPACMTIFQAITEEGWTDIMYQIMDADSYIFASLYFCLLIIFGSFVCLNLTLAVLWNEFDNSRSNAEKAANLAASVRAQYSGGTKEEEMQKEEDEEKKKADAKKASSKSVLSFFICGSKGSHADCGLKPVEMTHNLVDSGYCEAFIVVCILLNTVTLSMDSYSMNRDMGSVIEVINFILTLIFILEMVLKIVGYGLRDYLKDAFNRFDACIVIGSIVEMALMPPSFIKARDSSGGGALSALRSFRLFRLFKLARSWKSLHHLLATMVNTLDKLGNFALLLLLFIYIFALCGLQFFANRFRFGDDGKKIEFTVQSPEMISQSGWTNQWNTTQWLTYGMQTAMWQDPDNNSTFLNPAFFAADVPRAHFDDVWWSATTIFQVLSGENWNTVMYDGRRSTTWLACLFFVVLVVLGIMIVLELFVAVLLGEFEKDDEEEEDGEAEDGEAAEKFGGVGMINGAHAMTKHMDGDDAAKAQSLDEFSFLARIAKWLECGSSDGAPGAKVVPMDDAAADAAEATKTSGGEDATESKSVKFDADAKKGAEEDGKEPLVKTEKKLKGMAFFMTPENPLRKTVSLLVFHPFFDQFILFLIILSSIMLAIESPLDDPNTTRFEIFKALNLIFTIAFIVELFLKHLVLGLKQYWKDAWNMLDGVIVLVSVVVLASDGNPSLSSLKALRTLRVLRPLRMINRAPGLKRVVNALLFSLPKILDVLVVCGLFFLIFAIVGINFLKGRLNGCSGDMSSAEEQFLHKLDWDLIDPKTTDLTWTYKQRLIEEESPFTTCTPMDIADVVGEPNFYFNMKGDFTFIFDETPEAGTIYSKWDDEDNNFTKYKNLGEWQEDTLPYNFNTDENDISCQCKEDAEGINRWACDTSKDACYGLWMADKDVGWGPIVYQSFDNIFVAMSCLFEISTTEGWVDVMYAAVDAEGVDMQPDRHANHMEWVVFFVAFIICGSFFVLNLFVGVVCDTFNEMKEQFGDNFLMTETQQEWVQMRKKINKLGPYLKMHVLKQEPEGWRLPFHTLVTKPKFDHVIMGCIIANTCFMSVRHFGQPYWVEMTLTVVNLIFAVIFTVEMVLKLIGLQWRYFDDGWNMFDFSIVIATDVFIVVRYTTELDLVSLATVMRTFRVLRVFRLIQSAKELRKLINTLIISLPQLANIAMLLLLCLFIFAVMGVQMFATVAFQDAYNEHANFQNFGVAILTLMRSTTGENWNGIMYSMAENVEHCVMNPEWDPLLCGMEGSIDECLPLNGCGKGFVAHWFWLLFTMLVSFVVLNVFVAVILEAFDNSNDEEDAKLTDKEWEVFCKTWINFVPKVETGKNEKEALETAFRIEMTQLLPLFKKLPYPMGFCREDGTFPSDKQCMDDLHKMDINAVRFGGADKQGLYAEFWEIALACARRVMLSDASDEDTAEMLAAMEHAETIERQQSGRNYKDVKSHKDAVVQLNAKQYFAALRIACAFRSHKFREKIAERVTVQQTMESTMSGPHS